MSTRSLTIVAVMVSVALAGCGDPKAASNSNFKKAINDILKVDNPLCYIVSTGQFPVEIRKDGKYSYGASLPVMNALEKAGVVTGKETKVKNVYEGMGNGGNDFVPGREFTVTQVGSLAYHAQLPPNTLWPQGGSGFCLGTAEVSDITDSTPPTTGLGGTTTDVKYTYKVKTPESWADSEEIENAFPAFHKAEVDGLPGEVKLERGVKGWRKSRD